jgi:hypothetical protein
LPLPFKALLAIFLTLMMQVVIPKLLISKLNGGLASGFTINTAFTISKSLGIDFFLLML